MLPEDATPEELESMIEENPDNQFYKDVLERKLKLRPKNTRVFKFDKNNWN